MLVAPFRVFGQAGSPTNVTVRRASSRNLLLVQRPLPAEVLLLLVRQSHFAVGRFLGLVVFPQRTAVTTLSDQPQPLVEFRLPPESCPTLPSQPPQQANSSHGLSFPAAHQDSAIHLLAKLAALRYVPSSGFGYPLDGLLPPSPCRPSFMPAALMGFALRSFVPSGRYPPVSRSKGPTYRLICRYSRLAEANWAGPTDRGSWALTLPEVPNGKAGFSTPTAGGSLGLRPSRVCQRTLCMGSYPHSSHALPGYLPEGRNPAAPRSIDRCPSGLDHGTPQGG